MKTHEKRTLSGDSFFQTLARRKLSVNVAEDVVRQVRAGRFQASEDCYVQDLRIDDLGSSIDLIEVLSKRKSACKACAIGCAFISMTSITGTKVNVDVGRRGLVFVEFETMFKTLLEAFSELQLAMIESAFQQNVFLGSMHFAKTTTKDELTEEQMTDICICAENFGRQFKRGSQRIVAIMQNIIENDGVFIPSGALEALQGIPPCMILHAGGRSSYRGAD